VPRPTHILAALAVAACLVAPSAGAHKIDQPRGAGVRLVWCYSAADTSARAMTVAAWIATKQPADVLALKVTLQARHHGSAWLPVDAPDLGVWHQALAGKLDYHFRQKIQGLFDDARFRAVVSYRWSRDGVVVARARHRSPVCVQPDQRPSLRPSHPKVLPLAGGGTGYKVRVLNTGRTPAAGFDVSVTGDGVRASLTADRLEAGQERRIVVGGPPCRPGTRVRIVVDAKGNVDEADETDNAVTVTCPA
jgi:hypothetical protein